MRKSEAIRICLAVYAVKTHALDCTSNPREIRAIRGVCNMLGSQIVNEIYKRDSHLISVLGTGSVKVPRAALLDAVTHGIIPPKAEA